MSRPERSASPSPWLGPQVFIAVVALLLSAWAPVHACSIAIAPGLDEEGLFRLQDEVFLARVLSYREIASPNGRMAESRYQLLETLRGQPATQGVVTTKAPPATGVAATLKRWFAGKEEFACGGPYVLNPQIVGRTALFYNNRRDGQGSISPASSLVLPGDPEARALLNRLRHYKSQKATP